MLHPNSNINTSMPLPANHDHDHHIRSGAYNKALNQLKQQQQKYTLWKSIQIVFMEVVSVCCVYTDPLVMLVQTM